MNPVRNYLYLGSTGYLYITFAHLSGQRKGMNMKINNKKIENTHNSLFTGLPGIYMIVRSSMIL